MAADRVLTATSTMIRMEHAASCSTVRADLELHGPGYASPFAESGLLQKLCRRFVAKYPDAALPIEVGGWRQAARTCGSGIGGAAVPDLDQVRLYVPEGAAGVVEVVPGPGAVGT